MALRETRVEEPAAPPFVIIMRVPPILYILRSRRHLQRSLSMSDVKKMSESIIRPLARLL